MLAMSLVIVIVGYVVENRALRCTTQQKVPDYCKPQLFAGETTRGPEASVGA